MAYCYEPLSKDRKEIRLLRPHLPTQWKDCKDLQFTLHPHSLIGNPELAFTAISYCWGDIPETESILVGGFELQIPASAEAVLRFALEKGETVIWIDAICINQSDRVERGHQVSLMRDVYSCAKHVLVYLGEDSDLTASAISSIQSIINDCRRETENCERLDETIWAGTEEERYYLYSDKSLPASCDWVAIYDFYKSPWFTRLWPVQEVCLAKEARCYRGSHLILWSDIALAARWMYYCKYWNPGGSRNRGIDCAAEVFDNMQGVKGLYELFAMCIYFDATDPRDKIYALLGMIPVERPGGPADIVPDYENRTLSDIYTSATRYTLLEGSMTALGRASWLRPPRQQRKYPLGLSIGFMPSWVPRMDWVWDPEEESPSGIMSASKQGASDGLKVCIAKDAVDTDILRIRGVAVSSIRLAGPVFTPLVFRDPKEIKGAILDSYALARRSSSYTCENDMVEAFIATLCAGKNGNADPIESDRLFIDDFVLFLSGQNMSDLASGTSSSVLTSNEAMTLLRAISTNMEEWAMNRRLVITDDGLLGLAPMNSKTGDSLIILFGDFAPWLLREDIDSWKLIGDVYSHHVMKGEYIQSLRDAGTLENETRWFDLR